MTLEDQVKAALDNRFPGSEVRWFEDVRDRYAVVSETFEGVPESGSCSRGPLPSRLRTQLKRAEFRGSILTEKGEEDGRGPAVQGSR